MSLRVNGKAMELLMGIEQELAFCASGPGGERINGRAAIEKLLAAASRKLVHLPAAGESGIFLGGGGRLYLDCGHVEVCSADLSDPVDVVNSLLSFEGVLNELADELAAQERLSEVFFSRCNVDYQGNTFGTHESYLTRTEPKVVGMRLLPFLASRVIIVGGGGLQPSNGCRFTLSPRASYVTLTCSASSTGARAMVHIRDQPLAGAGYHRLHLILSEARNSHLGNFLTVATTAMSAALADAGIHPDDVELLSPVDALRAFASDPACKATARSRSGQDLTAIDIQYRYLALARANMGRLPGWAPAAIEKWDEILGRLQNAPEAVDASLDWAIKYRMLTEYIEKKNFSWRKLEQWSHLTDLLQRCARVLQPKGKPVELTSAFVVDPRGCLCEIARQFEPHLAARGLRWEELDAFGRLRAELLELDFRFTQFGSRGLFNALSAGGVLDHSVPGVTPERIADAAEHAPGSGRAKLRGDVIRKLHKRGKADRFGANWTSIVDTVRGTAIDLTDPFCTVEKWKKKSSIAEDGDELQGGGVESDFLLRMRQAVSQ